MLVYPEGDDQEISWSLRFGQIVDVTGRPLAVPIASARMLAYRVRRVSTEETRNEDITSYHLEQVFPDELAEFTEPGL